MENVESEVDCQQEVQETKTPKVFTLEALKIIKEYQQQHGLRHGDYDRYRAYCARRLSRLRKTLNFKCGNTRRFQKREVTVNDLTDSKFLLIPLMQAERAWAYSMQLKQEANTDPRKRFHLINRLRKAVKHANDFEVLSQSSVCDARTKLEAQGYSSIMNGQLNFELQKWIESLKYFNIAKKIYENLTEALKGDDTQVFYSQKVDEIIPNIRYCNYNLGDESARKDLVDLKLKSGTGSELAENIDVLISQTKENQILTFSEITWRNKIKIQIKNEKVKLFLLNLQEYEKQIEEANDFDGKIAFYESILKDLVDVVQIVRDELKLDQTFQSLQRGQPLPPDEKPSNLILLFSYLTWTRISKTIERNLLMLDSYQQTLNSEEKGTKNVKPQDIVRLYDIILQNLKDMANLPGLLYDEKFILENEFLITFHKAFRCYYISLFYLASKKYKEATGFFFRVENYVKKIDANLKSLDKTSELFDSKSSFERKKDILVKELNQSKYKIQTAAILEAETNENEENLLLRSKLDKMPLVDRLDTFYDDSSLTTKSPNVIKLPLTFEPIPCKPLFFDVALYQLDLPSYDDKIAPKNQEQQKAGVKGFIKNMFGFGK